MKKFRPKNIFDQQKKSTKKCFDQKFPDFFRRKFFRPEIFGLPIPIPNFPKIPKITLRTACDHFKKQLEQKVTVYVLLDHHGTLQAVTVVKEVRIIYLQGVQSPRGRCAGVMNFPRHTPIGIMPNSMAIPLQSNVYT